MMTATVWNEGWRVLCARSAGSPSGPGEGKEGHGAVWTMRAGWPDGEQEDGLS